MSSASGNAIARLHIPGLSLLERKRACYCNFAGWELCPRRWALIGSFTTPQWYVDQLGHEFTSACWFCLSFNFGRPLRKQTGRDPVCLWSTGVCSPFWREALGAWQRACLSFPSQDHIARIAMFQDSRFLNKLFNRSAHSAGPTYPIAPRILVARMDR